jgi:hypothetical protein
MVFYEIAVFHQELQLSSGGAHRENYIFLF